MGTVHGTALVVRDRGILLRGASGMGKSSTAAELISRARLRGEHAALVADDRVVLSAPAGRLVARAPAELAGLLEIRGVGIICALYDAAAVVRLVVDIVATQPDRLPEPDALTAELAGLRVPRVVTTTGDAVRLAELALAVLVDREQTRLPLAFAAQHAKHTRS